jgi:hypothetical protein
VDIKYAYHVGLEHEKGPEGPGPGAGRVGGVCEGTAAERVTRCDSITLYNYVSCR